MKVMLANKNRIVMFVKGLENRVKQFALFAEDAE